MFKKLLLCFSVIVSQNQLIQSSEFGDGLSEGFAPRKSFFQLIQAAPRYVLDTIKSDLCIGNRVVQHNTFGSQLAAGARLCAYNIAPLYMLKIYSQYYLSIHVPPIRVPAKALDNMSQRAFLVIGANVLLIAPIIEETFYTILPQLLKKFTRKKIGNCSEIIPVAASLLFALMHRDYSSWSKACCAAVSYSHHRYMKNRSCKTIVPFVSHSLHNIIVNSPFMSPFRSIKDAIAVQILRFYAAREGLNVSFEQLLINLINQNAMEDEFKKTT